MKEKELLRGISMRGKVVEQMKKTQWGLHELKLSCPEATGKKKWYTAEIMNEEPAT